MTGFLEETPGVKSSTRLIALWCIALASVIVAAILVYVFRRAPDSAILSLLVALVGTFVIHGAVAIVNRNAGDEK